jgi:hypothetical protein
MSEPAGQPAAQPAARPAAHPAAQLALIMQLSSQLFNMHLGRHLEGSGAVHHGAACFFNQWHLPFAFALVVLVASLRVR